MGSFLTQHPHINGIFVDRSDQGWQRIAHLSKTFQPFQYVAFGSCCRKAGLSFDTTETVPFIVFVKCPAQCTSGRNLQLAFNRGVNLVAAGQRVWAELFHHLLSDQLGDIRGMKLD